VLAHVVRLVGDQQRRRLGAAAPVHARPRGERGVGDRDPVPVARLRAGRVGPVAFEVDPVARGVERPLAADVRGRRQDRHASDPAVGEQPMRHVQTEGGLPAAGVADARKEPPSCASTAAAAACCQARSGRPAGHAGSGRRRPKAGWVTADGKGAAG
jgi:hypothetical protein